MKPEETCVVHLHYQQKVILMVFDLTLSPYHFITSSPILE